MLAWSSWGSDAPLKDVAFLHEILPVCSTLTWLVAYAALLQKLRKERNAQGISLQSLLALAVGEVAGLIFLLIVVLKVSSAEPGGFGGVSLVSFVCQSVNAVLVTLTFYLSVRNFTASYQKNLDSFGDLSQIYFLRKLFTNLDDVIVSPNISTSDESPDDMHKSPLKSPKSPNRNIQSFLCSTKTFVNQFPGVDALKKVCGWHWLTFYAIAFILAIPLEVFRTHKALGFCLSYLACVGDMIPALSLLPQLSMFYKSKNQGIPIARSMARFIVAMLVARLFSLAYWGTDRLFHGSQVMPGRGVKILTETINILILGDFCWYFARSKITGLPLPL